jgi:hypothetical protein
VLSGAAGNTTVHLGSVTVIPRGLLRLGESVSHLETPALPAELLQGRGGPFPQNRAVTVDRHSPSYRPHEGFIQYDNRMICEVETVCFND